MNEHTHTHTHTQEGFYRFYSAYIDIYGFNGIDEKERNTCLGRRFWSSPQYIKLRQHQHQYETLMYYMLYN